MKKVFLLSIFCFYNATIFAQVLPKVYNQFFMNPYVYNPAYAGVDGHTVLFSMHREQWAGLSDAPSHSHVNVHLPLKGGLAFGALAYSENHGLFKQSGGKLSTGYLVNIDREHFIRFGMSLGAGNNTINFGEFDSPGDRAFQNLLTTQTFLIGDVGVAYHTGHFNFGISLPSLFSYEFITQESTTPIIFKPHDNIYFKVNYRGHLSDNIAIEPHLLYRYQSILGNQYEATMLLHLMHVVWVGATYRQDAGLVGLMGVKVKEKLGIGYSYEYGNPNYGSVLGPTHEIHLGLHISSRHHHAEHAHSFIKSHKKSAEERAKEKEEKRQQQLLALQQSRNQVVENNDELTLVAKPKEIPKPKNNWNYEKENEPIERVNQFGETERGIKFDRINENGEIEVVFSWLPPPPEGSKTETYEIANPNEEPIIRIKPNGKREAGIKWIRTIDGGQKETLIIWDEILSKEESEKLDHNPSESMSMENAVISIVRQEQPKENVFEPEVEQVIEKPVENKKENSIIETIEPKPDEEKPILETPKPPVVKKGNHLLELPSGNYIVAGVFNEFWNAENFSDLMFKRGFHDTKNGFISAKGHFYVVISESSDLERLTKEKNRIRNMKDLSHVWILTVE